MMGADSSLGCRQAVKVCASEEWGVWIDCGVSGGTGIEKEKVVGKGSRALWVYRTSSVELSSISSSCAAS